MNSINTQNKSENFSKRHIYIQLSQPLSVHHPYKKNQSLKMDVLMKVVKFSRMKKKIQWRKVMWMKIFKHGRVPNQKMMVHCN